MRGRVPGPCARGPARAPRPGTRPQLLGGEGGLAARDRVQVRPLGRASHGLRLVEGAHRADAEAPGLQAPQRAGDVLLPRAQVAAQSEEHRRRGHSVRRVPHAAGGWLLAGCFGATLGAATHDLCGLPCRQRRRGRRVLHLRQGPLRAHPGHAARGALRDRELAGHGRHGPGVPGPRPRPRRRRGDQGPALRDLPGAGHGPPVPQRDQAGPPGQPPQRLPHPRIRRARGDPVHLDGVRRRRHPAGAAAGQPPLPGGRLRRGHPGRPGPAGRARHGRHPPGLQGQQHHDRLAGRGPADGLRHRQSPRSTTPPPRGPCSGPRST